MNSSSASTQPTNFSSLNPTPNPNPNPTANPSDLSTTLSSLKNLISFCHQTLQNSNFLPKPQNDNLLRCPYNPHHLMPPESLFPHTLRCPFPLDLDPPNYQNTLQSSSLFNQQNAHFTVQDYNQELCFSLDDYLSNVSSANFFYQDCPAAVALSDFNTSSSSKKTFTLPGILCMEFANVVCFSNGEARGKIDVFEDVGFRILSSDLWFVRREVENWRDYEHLNMYSFNVFCAILGLRMVKVSDFSKWVIVNSLRFGVVIDVYMRDHISMLVGLCLKAVIREALGFVELVKRQELETSLKSITLKCPVLKQAFMWLASQLSVLYGEVNGKNFTIEIFKQCISESASGLLLFPLEQSLTELSNLKEGDWSLHASPSDTRDVKVEKPLERNAMSGLDERVGETVHSKVIFVSHVVAAVVALHERFLLEEKIRALRGLRVSQPLTSYQRMAEHAYLSSRADEERKKRPNYRPIIEHDGLPRQQSSNQESSKTKTREELLAEERDYKRRRMSYRGKKVKRTNLQVVRDLIEEYVEEIKEAGGIGCFEKGDQGGRILPSKPSTLDLAIEVHDDRTSDSDLVEAVRGRANNYREQPHHDHDIKSTSTKDTLTRDRERSRWGHHGHLQEQSYLDREKHSEYYSRSTERRRSHDRSREQSNHQREREDIELTGTRHREFERKSSGTSKYRDYRPYYSTSNSRRRGGCDDQNADSLAQKAFEDRYDPSESHNMDEDNVSNGGKYVKPE